MAPGKRAGVKDNRGGAREGAGRKPRVFSDDFKERMHGALEKKAKAEGQTFHEMIVDLAYDKRLPPLARVALMKIIASTMTVRESHQTIDKREIRAVVMLPPVQAGPQKLVEGAGPVIDGATGEVLPESSSECKVQSS